MRLGIFDFDSAVFSVASRNAHLEPFNVVDRLTVQLQIDSFVSECLDECACTHYIGFVEISSEPSFRDLLATTKPYKGNRPPKPDYYRKWGPFIKLRLINHWKFVDPKPLESDDAATISMNHYKNSVLIGIDKDLKQVEGMHYNFNKHHYYLINEEEANFNLWKQVITGDTSDNVPGLKGWGKKTAEKYLKSKPNLEIAVKQLYVRTKGLRKGMRYFREQYRLIKLLDKPDYGFVVPEPITYI